MICIGEVSDHVMSDEDGEAGAAASLAPTLAVQEYWDGEFVVIECGSLRRSLFRVSYA